MTVTTTVVAHACTLTNEHTTTGNNELLAWRTFRVGSLARLRCCCRLAPRSKDGRSGDNQEKPVEQHHRGHFSGPRSGPTRQLKIKAGENKQDSGPRRPAGNGMTREEEQQTSVGGDNCYTWQSCY
jgi:hypothetical protein